MNSIEQHIIQYFNAERQESWICIVCGIIALRVSAYGLFQHRGIGWIGAAGPLIGIAVIQIVVGVTILIRARKHARRLIQQVRETPEQFATEELRRMAHVKRKFRQYHIIELMLFLMGFTFMLLGGFMKMGELMFGSGVALSIQSTSMLLLDLSAEYRASNYLSTIHRWLSED